MFKATTSPQDPMILQFVPILTQACEILREEYQRYCSGEAFNIEKKNDDSPVTQADYRVNRYLTEALAHISDLPLLSEEGKEDDRKHWQEFWLLDPLDGTKEFLHKRPEFTINLSLIKGSLTTFAILAIPAQRIIYFCPEQGLPLKYHYQIQQWFTYFAVETAVIHVGLSQSSQKKPKYQQYLDQLAKLTDYAEFKAGSAYKFCMILEDQVDIYPRFHPTCEWDTSAGQCMIERIGGGLVDFKGRPFIYNQRDTLLNGGFIAYKNAQMKTIALQALHEMHVEH
ncbi:3'(2'),5'-bisphosphate nucleotidase CysQ [Acinetobacter wanghuae]|uniref:3'(2'),5'-bisphosphate nucleotidase CysQ n=1 Tax=Acinetobacter wanghuae TaxID=2662362 RepID=A0A5Q0P2H0_9GAMM|nr:3'(2'),5'-bisphosphate nucleotidase CysQ [Acinetobacter wanghuae]MQW91581.1 3'(2'),5'-bisphosphate nucleotidase CysQ [Acinetobacter wanghuae]QGA10936.1 3'(2'),5'-bisphosphate nucleotidase CysQ [Acinetobacter wanghuae]